MTEEYKILLASFMLRHFSIEELEDETGIDSSIIRTVIKANTEYFLEPENGEYFLGKSKGNALEAKLERLLTAARTTKDFSIYVPETYKANLQAARNLLLSIQNDSLPLDHREAVLQNVREVLDLARQDIQPLDNEVTRGEWLKFNGEFEEVEEDWIDAMEHIGEADLRHEWLAKVLHQRTSFPSAHLRTDRLSNVFCEGRDEDITGSIIHLGGNGFKMNVVYGPPGIGKTVLAQAIVDCAPRLDPDSFAPSFIHRINCTPLPSFDDVIGLLITELSGVKGALIPNDSRGRAALLSHTIDTVPKGLPHLLVFDDSDHFCRSPKDPLCKVFRMFKSRKRNFKLLLTFTKRPDDKLFDWCPEAQIKFSGLGPLRNLSTQPTKSLYREPIPLSIWTHPLARALIENAPNRPNLAEVIAEPSALQRTCSALWRELTPNFRWGLKMFTQLPGGLWLLANAVDSHPAFVGWSELFENGDGEGPMVENSLEQLAKLQWLERRLDFSDPTMKSMVFTLQPALHRFVESEISESERLTIRRRVIRFWAKRLKKWCSIATARTPAPLISRVAGGFFVPIDHPELAARHLQTVTALNWRYAFHLIDEVIRPAAQIHIYAIFLRSISSYCRFSGTLWLFNEFALSVERKIPDYKSNGLRSRMDVASCLGMLGRNHRRLGNLAQAERALLGALCFFANIPPEAPEFKREHAWILAEMGRVLHVTGEWLRAEKCFRESIEIVESLVLTRKVSSDLLQLASVRIALGNLLNDSLNLRLR